MGFMAERMGRNGYADCDLDTSKCPVLSLFHIECKAVENMWPGSKLWLNAWEQCLDYPGRDGRIPLLIGKQNRRPPWATTIIDGLTATVFDETIKPTILRVSSYEQS
jgi:hypothetical protein